MLAKRCAKIKAQFFPSFFSGFFLFSWREARERGGLKREAFLITIHKKLYLMLFFVLFVIAGMTMVTYVRSSSVVLNLVESAGMDTAKTSVRIVDSFFEGYATLIDSLASTVQETFSNQEGDVEQIMEDYLKSAMGGAREHGFNVLFFGLESSGRLSDASMWREPEDYDSRGRI